MNKEDLEGKLLRAEIKAENKITILNQSITLLQEHNQMTIEDYNRQLFNLVHTNDLKDIHIVELESEISKLEH